MHKRLLLILLLFCLNILCSQAVRWSADNLTIPFLQDSTQHVCNPDQILSPRATNYVNQKLTLLEGQRGVQSLVIVVNQFDNTPYNVGMQLARKYKIGSKEQRSGLLVLLAIEDRKYYILTGHGLEGTLPDAICKRIENRIMEPYLQQRDWDNAITQTITALYDRIITDTNLSNTKKKESSSNTGSFLFLLLLLVFLIFLFYSPGQRTICPQCRKKTFKDLGFVYMMRQDKKVRMRHWKCSHCRHEDFEEAPPEDNDKNNGMGRKLLTAIALASLLAPKRGNGGSFNNHSGGTFGGGSFGGGGAGGDF